MKKILAMSVLFLFMSGSFALAHPPADIIVNYNSNNKILSVGIAHTVENPQKHFIRLITIKVNGKDWITQNFSNQINADTQAASYAVVDLKKGDLVEVTAYCNKKGELTKGFKIQ